MKGTVGCIWMHRARTPVHQDAPYDPTPHPPPVIPEARERYPGPTSHLVEADEWVPALPPDSAARFRGTAGMTPEV